MAGTCGCGEGLSGSINAGNFLTSCKVYWLASQEGLCCMEYAVYIPRHILRNTESPSMQGFITTLR